MGLGELNSGRIEQLLRSEDRAELDQLYTEADRVRGESVGDEVHLRGLIEISNHCTRHCVYCGLRAPNTKIPRYRMSHDEVLASARMALEFGYGTVVLQAGEDPEWSADDVTELVKSIKSETGLAVTLSLGERDPEEYQDWRDAGADRVLLRFETSDPVLFKKIHPRRADHFVDRVELLRTLRSMGYEIGSGVMVGLPGQTFSSVAEDLLLFRDLDLDMVGLGPFVCNPDTPLGQNEVEDAGENQVPATNEMALRVIALTRLLRPDANIPSTSAIAAVDPESGHSMGLGRGANVIMPNLTPLEYRRKYQIYPGKIYADEASESVNKNLVQLIHTLGRRVGLGPGNRVRPTP